MKLDRETHPDKRGKYALIKLRGTTAFRTTEDGHVLVPQDAIDYGDWPHSEFFVIRVRDTFAVGAIRGYANEINNAIVSFNNGIIGLREAASGATGCARDVLLSQCAALEQQVRGLREYLCSINRLSDRAMAIKDTKFPD